MYVDQKCVSLHFDREAVYACEMRTTTGEWLSENGLASKMRIFHSINSNNSSSSSEKGAEQKTSDNWVRERKKCRQGVKIYVNWIDLNVTGILSLFQFLFVNYLCACRKEYARRNQLIVHHNSIKPGKKKQQPTNCTFQCDTNLRSKSKRSRSRAHPNTHTGA